MIRCWETDRVAVTSSLARLGELAALLFIQKSIEACRAQAQIAARRIRNDELSGEIRLNGFGRRIPGGVHREDFRLDVHDIMNDRVPVERIDLKFTI